MLTISKTFRFEASHVLPRHPGKCSRLHGHSWVLTVSVRGEVDPHTGFVCDFYDLTKVVNLYVVEILDHSHLGQYLMFAGYGPEDDHVYAGDKSRIVYGGYPFSPDFYPSSENLVTAIAKILQPLIKEIKDGLRLYEVRLEETCTSAATWRAADEQ